MAYAPATDFLGLIRQTSGGARMESMPGLDYVMAALQRIGFCDLWVNPTTAPTDPATVWLKTSSTDWAAEGSVFLYDALTASFQPATPALWRELASVLTGYVFQSVTGAAAAINLSTTLLAVQRDNPGVTTLALPSVVGRSSALQIVDFSTNVAAHQVIMNPNGVETIMRLASFSMYSTAVQLAGVTLYPAPELNAWVIAS